MTWFVASIVSMIEVLDGGQTEFPIFEDFYLFEAHSEIELQTKIKKKMEIIDSAGKCEYQGHPAMQRCVGTRKVRSIYNEPPLSLDAAPPGDYSELSHSYFIAKSKDDVRSFASGKPTRLLCVDDSDEEESPDALDASKNGPSSD